MSVCRWKRKSFPSNWDSLPREFNIANLQMFLFISQFLHWHSALFKNGPFPAYFSLFSTFQYSWQLTFNINIFQWLKSNCGPLKSEATLDQLSHNHYFVYIVQFTHSWFVKIPIDQQAYIVSSTAPSSAYTLWAMYIGTYKLGPQKKFNISNMYLGTYTVITLLGSWAPRKYIIHFEILTLYYCLQYHT